MQISVTVDTAEWEAALDRMLEACRSAAKDASMAGAEAIQRETRGLLSLFPHPPGTHTYSAAGLPPGYITGELMESVIVTEDGDYAEVGPTTAYGREQELGGPMHGHPWMHWRDARGRSHFRRFVDLPHRPYLEPATGQVVDDGELTEIYYEHWAAAIEKALG